LARTLGGRPFLEPEEKHWPTSVSDRKSSGYFTALMWFRSARVPMYYRAQQVRESGGIAFLDSYYDKLCSSWLGLDGMDWLISKADPYFVPAVTVAHLDREQLPLADILVIFTIDQPIWETFIEARGRKLDRESGLANLYFTQRYFVEAAERLAAETGIRLVRFHQDRVDSPDKAAARLAPSLT
jgi:hypothetical protein